MNRTTAAPPPLTFSGVSSRPNPRAVKTAPSATAWGSTSDGTTTRPTMRYFTSPFGLVPVTSSPIEAPIASIVSVPTATSSAAAGARPSSTVGSIEPRNDANPTPPTARPPSVMLCVQSTPAASTVGRSCQRDAADPHSSPSAVTAFSSLVSSTT